MMLKKISLAAALAAAFITGSAAVAYAESGAGTPGDDGNLTESMMQADYAAKHGGDRALSSEIPMTGGHANGYVPKGRIVRSHKNGRNT